MARRAKSTAQDWPDYSRDERQSIEIYRLDCARFLRILCLSDILKPFYSLIIHDYSRKLSELVPTVYT